VWKARDRKKRRIVALKILTSEALADPELRRRFVREMEIVSSIRNVYVLDVYDWYEGDPPYIAMPLIEGNNLATEIKAGPLSVPRAVSIVEMASTGLQAAHDKKLRHRDVKPSNILLDTGQRAGADHVWLIDWGIAHEIDTEDPNITRVGQMVGTPAYVAPERLLSDQGDKQSDIYSLAVTFYEMLTGRLPYGEHGHPFPIAAHLVGTPRPLPLIVPAALRDVVMKGMARERADRYPTAAEFGQAAYDAINQAPVQISAPPAFTLISPPKPVSPPWQPPALPPVTPPGLPPTRPPRQHRRRTGLAPSLVGGGAGAVTGVFGGASWLAPVMLAVAGAGIAWSAFARGSATPPAKPDDTTHV
jgi:serine/threonine kinase PknH